MNEFRLKNINELANDYYKKMQEVDNRIVEYETLILNHALEYYDWLDNDLQKPIIHKMLKQLIGIMWYRKISQSNLGNLSYKKLLDYWYDERELKSIDLLHICSFFNGVYEKTWVLLERMRKKNYLNIFFF